jgi:hypothetical protein
MAESAPVAGAAVVADSLATGSAAAPGEATEEQREARDDLLDERDDERDDLAQMRPRIVREKGLLARMDVFPRTELGGRARAHAGRCPLTLPGVLDRRTVQPAFPRVKDR